MFCPNCGTQVPDGSAFCSNCGTRLNAPPQPGSQPRPVYQQPQQSGQTPYQQPRQAQPRPVYQQPQQQKSAGAKKAAEKPAKKGGFGKKLVAAALVGTVGFFGVKALLNGLDGGGDPDDDWREGPPEPVPPYSDSYDYSGSGGSGSSGSNGGYSNPGSTGSSDPVFDESGRFKGKSGVGQLAVAEGEAAGLTTEEAAAQDIFYVFQVMDYATKEDSADYESDFFMVKIDEEKGVAYLLESIDDDDPIPCRYDKSSGTLTLSSTEDGDSVDMTLKRQPNGSFTGSADGVVDGENRHAYIALNRITPTKDGRWLSLDSGEVFDDYDLGDLSETELG
ncbi:MAG: zinc-ribbon domain-containing protein, partial [Oscillospiraceae bacterium]|nr:zinc-ribbon domain-containing protein [Oscillospiraceae bacterium]